MCAPSSALCEATDDCSGRFARTWSGIYVAEYGPDSDSVYAAPAARLLSDSASRRQQLDDSSLYATETAFEADGTVMAFDKPGDTIGFVVPRILPKNEIWYRYEQTSNWWMMAYGFYWWICDKYGAAVDPLLAALDIQIIDRSWQNPIWRYVLFDDPRKTLEAETGGTFALDLHVCAVEETDGHVLVSPGDPAHHPVKAGA